MSSVLAQSAHCPCRQEAGKHSAARSPALRAAPRRTQRGTWAGGATVFEVSSLGAVCAQWSAHRTARSTTSTQSVTRCISSIRQGLRWMRDSAGAWIGDRHTCRTLTPIPANDHAESCVAFTKRSAFDGRAMRWTESYGDLPATRPNPSLPRAATTGAAPPPNPQDSLRAHSVVPARATVRHALLRVADRCQAALGGSLQHVAHLERRHAPLDADGAAAEQGARRVLLIARRAGRRGAHRWDVHGAPLRVAQAAASGRPLVRGCGVWRGCRCIPRGSVRCLPAE